MTRLLRIQPGMLIVIRQDGGLGNQLFQYATGLYFAKKYQASLRIATDLPAKRSSHGHARPFLLPKFSISASYSQISTLERLILSISPKLDRVAKPIRSIRRIQVIRERPYEQIFNRELTVATETRIAYLVGKWQYYPPAQMVEHDLRTELSIREAPKGNNPKVACQIQASSNAVSLHIRRGDYAVEYPQSVLPPEYYLKARDEMRTRLGNPTFFVFSDDPAFAHQFAAGNPDCIVVDHNDAESAHEDLRLISLCRHHIIANSTFSWWGAWLNPSRSKTVLAPRTWTKFETQQSELALPGWSFI